jgi:hypothetical protein
MTPAEETTRLQRRVARAITSGTFEEAGGLLELYFARVEQAISELPPAERGEFASHVLEFYRWAISLARASRAQACTQLRELSPPSPYHSMPAKSLQLWQYDA